MQFSNAKNMPCEIVKDKTKSWFYMGPHLVHNSRLLYKGDKVS